MAAKSLAGNSGQIYPRRYFDASPTWFAWNKIRAQDVHRLKDEAGFEGQNIFFHLNHPIQYVSLSGLAVQIELGGGMAAAKYCFVTLDDGSGELLNVKITRRPADQVAKAEYPSNTLVDNVDVNVTLGVAALAIDGRPVTVGQPIRVRGSLETYRGVRQLDLKRIKLIQNTVDEVKEWQETVEWKITVLNKAWVLSMEKMKELDAAAHAQQMQAAERQQKKRAWHARHAEKRRRADAKYEIKRQALDSRYNNGALTGSNIIKAPWDR